MESGDLLMTFIVPDGAACDVMAVAREAGAQGGTILNAHGTYRGDDAEFFGMTLGSEKEMLVIVAEEAAADKILNAVKELAVFKKTGGGIIYTTAVKRFVP